MRTLATFLSCTGVLVLVTGCAAQTAQVRVDQAESGLPNCRTFAWHPISGDVQSFTDQRVKAAVMSQLETKGYQVSADGPDCRIAYRLTTHEGPRRKPGIGVGVGGGSGGLGGGIGVTLPVGRQPAAIGTFTLDVIDASKNAQVWSGAIDVQLAEPELTDAEAQQMAEQVLGKYPDATRPDEKR